MSNYPPFFATPIGKKFYDRDVPKLVKALEKIGDGLSTPKVVETALMDTAKLLRRLLDNPDLPADEQGRAAATLNTVVLALEEIGADFSSLSGG
jgi:hypothetical protein